MVSKESLSKENLQELQRYSDSTLIVTLISKIMQENQNLGKLIFIEKELKKINDELKNKISGKDNGFIHNNFKDELKKLDKIEVDLITQEEKSNIIEFKTSISSNDAELESTISQILNRDTDLLDDFSVLEVSNIIFICHKDDLNNVLTKFDQDSRRESMKRPVSFIEWVQADNKNHEPCLYLEVKKDYSQTHLNLIKEINKNGSFCELSNNLYLLRQKKNFTFTGKKPPVPYLLSKLHSFFTVYLHPIMTRPNAPEEYKIPGSISDLCNEFIEQNKNDYSKPKTKWFYEGIDFFKKLEFVRLDGESLFFNIKNFTKNRREKDLDRFICNFCATEKSKILKKQNKKIKKTEEKKKVLQSKVKSQSLDQFI